MDNSMQRLNTTRHPPKEEIESQALDVVLALILGLGGFALYLATLAPTVLFADGGEFQFVPYILGIAHPTGYPLYLLLGWVWSHALPIGDVAYRMNLFSALWAALAVGLSYPVALHVIRRGASGINPIAGRLAGMTSTATFAVGETFWSQAIIAEVYSFNAFFVVLVLLLLFHSTKHPTTEEAPTSSTGYSTRRSLALAAIYGLSLTHHPTMLLLLPGILAFLWLTGRPHNAHNVPTRSTPSRSPRGGKGARIEAAAPETRPLSLFAPRSSLRRAGFLLALIVALLAPLLLYL
jgi:hypothetical protein